MHCFSAYDLAQRAVPARIEQAPIESSLTGTTLDDDLAVARQAQSNLLPRNLKPVPWLEYGGACLEARGVSGDFYGFLDAPGKEFAALPMANLQATPRSQIPRSGGNLPRMLERVKRQFHEATDPHNFATLFVSQFHTASRRLRSVNCGHNPAILIRASGEVERLEAMATVLGAFRYWMAAEPAVAGWRHGGGQRLIRRFRERGPVLEDDLTVAVLRGRTD